MVEEQRVQIGTMKALGYSKGAIAAKYIGYALSASVIGSIIGVLIGEKIFPFIIIYAYGIMYHHMSPILVPYVASYAIAASAVAVACTLLATIFSCYHELGAQAAVLMRPPAPKKGKRVLLERISLIWSHLNFSWKSSVRNLMRYKKRFFMTIFGIGGCMALMIVGYGIQDSVYEIADVQYSEIQTYDGQIILQDDLTDEERDDLQEFMAQDSDIDRSMEAYMKNLALRNGKAQRQTYIVVMSDVEQVPDYVDFHDRKTKVGYTLDDSGVIISEKTAKLLNVGVGDTVTVQNEDEGNRDVVISQICENYMGHYIYMTPTYYESVFGEEPTYNCILFAVQDSYDDQQMEEAGTRIMERDEVLSISYMHDIQKQLDDMLTSLNLVIVVLIISAGMLAFVVLYNLNTINITERQRELATLKVLGFYDPEVATYVFRENILLTFIGAAVGVVLGKVLTLFVIQTVEVDAAMFGREINLSSYVYSLLFTIAFSLIINFIMYFKLKKIDMVESLKSIE
jgi:putative ABC transport system permease protein